MFLHFRPFLHGSDDVEIMTAFMPVRHMIYFLQMMSIFTSPHLKLPPLFGAFLEWFANSSLMGVSATCLWARPVPDLYLLATTALLFGTFWSWCERQITCHQPLREQLFLISMHFTTQREILGSSITCDLYVLCVSENKYARHSDLNHSICYHTLIDIGIAEPASAHTTIARRHAALARRCGGARCATCAPLCGGGRVCAVSSVWTSAKQRS